jgi:hypothetical protein
MYRTYYSDSKTHLPDFYDLCALLAASTPSLKIPMSKFNMDHTFFFSPLEQFNILSLTDFTLSGGSEIFISSILLGI